MAPQSDGGTPRSVQDVANSNSAAGAPGSIFPESQMIGDKSSSNVSRSRQRFRSGPISCGRWAVEESDEDQEVAVGPWWSGVAHGPQEFGRVSGPDAEEVQMMWSRGQNGRVH